MKLIKDLLVFHLETTGQDPERDSIIQLAAVVLDKDSLLEKNFFNSYIKVSFLDSTLHQHSEQLGIEFETLRRSPKLTEVLKDFINDLGYEPLLATNSVQNFLFLRQGFKKSLLPFKYDRHVLDVWSLSYIYALHIGIKKIPTINTLATQFNLPKATNGLEYARLTAQVLRKIING
ncbi:MAG TPA: exonuclease domain-containing protein [Candidatus Doudnabacteria bacterium]|nr:exonuclease domain-containing protein [Candidatus Doudnabacteria bacterium]